MRLFFTLFLAVLTASVLSAQIPSNYYLPANNKSGTELQQALHDIIDNHTDIGYSALWTAYRTTDIRNNGSVWDIYSDKDWIFGSEQCGNYTSEGSCYNREHSFPKSWFGGEIAPMTSDLFQVYPSDGYVNSQRGNYPFGETDNPSYTSYAGNKKGPCSYPGYSGIVFEPIDEYKGDFARSYFYMATRYYGEDNSWPGSAMVDGAQPKEWAKNMLLEWHSQDPVSQKEIDRNNAIYSNYQHNRNPFIDHPEYAGYIWNAEKPNDNDSTTTVDIPSNYPTDFSGSYITLTWVDATGENLPDGYLVFISEQGYNNTPTPADGSSTDQYTTAKTVMYGVEKVTFGKLKRNTTYYFKMYPYTGSGDNTDYKTDDNVPQLLKKTE